MGLPLESQHSDAYRHDLSRCRLFATSLFSRLFVCADRLLKNHVAGVGHFHVLCKTKVMLYVYRRRMCRDWWMIFDMMIVTYLQRFCYRAYTAATSSGFHCNML